MGLQVGLDFFDCGRHNNNSISNQGCFRETPRSERKTVMLLNQPNKCCYPYGVIRMTWRCCECNFAKVSRRPHMRSCTATGTGPSTSSEAPTG
jgi:hypothetical protein